MAIDDGLLRSWAGAQPSDPLRITHQLLLYETLQRQFGARQDAIAIFRLPATGLGPTGQVSAGAIPMTGRTDPDQTGHQEQRKILFAHLRS
jgi:hypothetical protein